jgi:hypothetical protein
MEHAAFVGNKINCIYVLLVGMTEIDHHKNVGIDR